MASNRSLRRAQEPVTYACALCDSEDGVRWYCNDCHQNLCDWCKEAHTRGRNTENDHIVVIGEANRQDDKPVPEVCKLHPGKLCDLFCADCKELLCSICISKSHKHHDWKPFEDELSSKMQDLKTHMTAISAQIEHFKNVKSERNHFNELFNDNIDTMKKEVNTQRTKLKTEVDSFANAILAELSSLQQQESNMHKKDCERSEKKVKELTRLLEQAEMSNTSSLAVLETESSLRTTLSMYDVDVKNVLPTQPRFITGSVDRVTLVTMLGKLHHENHHKTTDIDCEQVQPLSKFTVTQQDQIVGICPVANNHAWLSIYQYQGLVLVNREGMVKETVELDFFPDIITMVGTTDILMTRYPLSTFVYKLPQHNKVTEFADIQPHKVYDISINERDEVFVSTGTPDILVLDRSGTIVRKVRIGSEDILFVACLSSGRLCVVQPVGVNSTDSYIMITDESCKLDNCQKVGSRTLCKAACDAYDRLFIPDTSNNQLYVLPREGAQITCLMDRKHGVVKPTAVGVDTGGNVWIRCEDGTVHVMGL